MQSPCNVRRASCNVVVAATLQTRTALSPAAKAALAIKKQTEYAQARAQIAARKQQEAEQRRHAWLAAKGVAYEAAHQAHAQADVQAYTTAREHVMSIRRQEAKPRAFEAGGRGPRARA